MHNLIIKFQFFIRKKKMSEGKNETYNGDENDFGRYQPWSKEMKAVHRRKG